VRIWGISVFTKLLLGVAVLILGWAGPGRCGDIVRVGGYDFPPFVEIGQGTVSGLTPDLLAALNNAQSRYEFRFVPTSARRRYSDVAEGRFDVMFFESPEWEWTQRNAAVDFSDVFLTGGEVFVAPAKPGRGQEWFDQLKGKRLVGILGYHYGFADFNADPAVLALDWNMKLVGSQTSGIEMVLAGRMDVGVVTDSYLWAYLKRNPDAAGKLLISQRYDQRYNHRVLVRRGGPIDSAAVNGLLDQLRRDGTLHKLWRQAGVIRD
jgi:polar amino acid transport system substrate-binding protein